jgi:hypothetical protein
MRYSGRPLRWARSQAPTFRRGFARSEDRCLEEFARRLRGTSAATNVRIRRKETCTR